MISRNMTTAHRFVVATNMPEGIAERENLKTVPVREELVALGRCWAKLALFAPDAREVFGERVLYVDLDQVTLRDLAPLVTDHEFRIMDATNSTMRYNAGLMLLTTGARRAVWDGFHPSMAQRLVNENSIGASDQYWITKVLGPREARWTDRDGVMSYRRHAVGPGGPPEHARIVMFPGPYDPSMPELRQRHKWIKDNWR
jgi:hypothetical protein